MKTELKKTPVLFAAVGLSRNFGGLLANQNIDLQLERGSIHALLGPNGAGKSTCINLLSGDLLPSSGNIYFRGRDITALSATKRSQEGIGRSYQRTNIFSSFTVLENVRLAAQSRRQNAWKIFSLAKKQTWTYDKAIWALSETYLSKQADNLAYTLSHGEQRQLEIAMVLATDAEVLLLDEPLAGMGAKESGLMVELLLKLRENRAILLVEHDMDAVFALAETITVMVDGQVLASGSPDEIRANELVQQAYLGVSDTSYV